MIHEVFSVRKHCFNLIDNFTNLLQIFIRYALLQVAQKGKACIAIFLVHSMLTDVQQCCLAQCFQADSNSVPHYYVIPVLLLPVFAFPILGCAFDLVHKYMVGLFKTYLIFILLLEI